MYKKLYLIFKWIIINQFEFNIKKFLNFFRNLNWFINDYYKFKKNYNGEITLKPCLHDKNNNSGDYKNEYFIQDLLVAQKIFKNRPLFHLDIGSRIDGFVAHIASFRNIEIMDIRNIDLKIENINYKIFDITDRLLFIKYPYLLNCYDSISCLHTLEHIGLGRYGDSVNSSIYIEALKNISKLLKLNGLFYLSVPVGYPKVEFNANRIFSINDLINKLNDYNLNIRSIILIDEYGNLKGDFTINKISEVISICNSSYHLAIFELEKCVKLQ